MCNRSTTKLVALAFLILTSAILPFALGVWQLKRLQWKKQLSIKVENCISSPATHLTSATQNLEYNKIIIFPLLRDKKNILIYSYRNKKWGYDKIILLQIPNSDYAILASTGWHEDGMKQELDNTEKHNIQEIRGIAEPIRKKRVFFLKNNLEQNRWHYLNMQDIIKYFDRQTIQPYIVQKEQNILQQHKNILIKHHLGYAIMWFALGIAFIIICAVKLLQDSSDRAFK